MKRHPPSQAIPRARQLRNNPTEAEKALWRLLRQHFPTAHFRRQVPLGPAIADFACHRARLVIEVDGGQHDAETDTARTRAIEAQGYRVIRFWNNEVLANGPAVIARIAEHLAPTPDQE